jgi:hypothetical protein
MSLVNYFTVTLVTLVIKIVCLLVTIAYYTLAERKIMASVQRRLGPNVVGFWGLLQPVSDGLKLFGKELVIPTHANSRIFIFAPIGVLLCAFLGWSVIPFCLFDHSTGMTTVTIRECLVSTIFGITLTPIQQLEKYRDDHRSQAASIKLLRIGMTGFSADGWRANTEEHEKMAEYWDQRIAEVNTDPEREKKRRWDECGKAHERILKAYEIAYEEWLAEPDLPKNRQEEKVIARALRKADWEAKASVRWEERLTRMRRRFRTRKPRKPPWW